MDDGDPRERATVASSNAVDADVDRHDPAQRQAMRQRGVQVLTVIAAAGMLGAAARHAVDIAAPTFHGSTLWSTVIVNVTGCLLIGALMVLIVEARSAHRLVRPFLGVGVLGGYTTFSTYTVNAQTLLVAGRPGVALAYLGGTAVAALAAVQLGVVFTRALTHPHTEAGTTRRSRPGGPR